VLKAKIPTINISILKKKKKNRGINCKTRGIKRKHIKWYKRIGQAKINIDG
jgi:hypothetical protein